MRGPLIGRAAAVSIAVHLALLLGSGALEDNIPTAETSEPTPPALDVTIVEIPDDGLWPVVNAAAPLQAREPARESRPAQGDRVASIEKGRPENVGTGESDSAPSGEEKPAGSLGMRNRRHKDLEKPSLYPAEPMAGPPEGISPLVEVLGPRRRESELRRRADGDYETDGGTFVAKTQRDGTVKIKDRRNFNIRFNLPSKKMVGALLKSWQADPYKHARGESEVELPSDAIVAGGFDVTDAFMRGVGDDPYITKKLDLLNRTRDERAGIAMKNKSADLADAARSSRKILAAVKARTDLTEREKRRIYFDLWDECAEAGSTEVLEAARAVRATIAGFVAANLPKGSSDAYSATELAELNRKRHSKERFAPYAKTR